MKKASRLTRLISTFLCAVMLLTLLPISNAMATTNGNLQIEDVYTDKAAYAPGGEAIITVQLSNPTSTNATEVVTLKTYHLENCLATDSLPVSVNANETTNITYTWNCPTNDYTGYIVEVSLNNGEFDSVAIDVSSDFSRFPRYGYSVDFDAGETLQESTALIEELVRDYHINVVQYYDWMWRHEKVVPSGAADFWIDMFGNTISKDSITQRINAGHLLNQSAMAYQMAYMAREDYEDYAVKKEWGLYKNKDYNTSYDKNDNSTINNIDQLIFPLEGDPAPVLHVFNPENKAWQEFMLNQYEDAIDLLGFDGIHIDQMGSYWGNIDYYDYNGNYVDLGKTFPGYVDTIKAGLENKYSAGAYVTMNMVNGGTPANDSFSSEYITKYADTDFSFSEIWENSNTYNDLKSFIEWSRDNSDGKAMVLAAYMNQYDTLGTTIQAEDAVGDGVYVATNPEGVTYMSGFDQIGDSLTFSVSVPEAGYYSLVMTYSNGTETRSTKSIIVDDAPCMTVSFDPTRTGVMPAEPSWGVFSGENAFTAPKMLYLSAGNHSIEIRQDATSTGGDIQLDKLTVSMFNDASVRLTDAAVAASGAYHIEMGTGLSAANGSDNYSDAVMLGHPYYPKAFKTMSSNLREAMKSHYDFITGYENLLYDPDVTPGDGGLQNLSIAGESISGSGEPGKIWFIPKDKGEDYSIVHLINLTSEQDTNWRNATTAPTAKNNLSVKYYYTNDRTVAGVYVASPDYNACLSENLSYTLGSDSTGHYIMFTVPKLEYWDMVFIKWAAQGSTTTIEAENMILSGVGTNTDHAGFSGTGFVDGYGDLYDSVTFDIVTPSDGYYSLIFSYANATDSECSRELFIDGESRGKTTFPNGSSWDEWRTVEKGIYLTAGVHRAVVLVTEKYSGFINLDKVTVTELFESSRSLYLNNWNDTSYIWKAADINPAQAPLSDGPGIYEMRYYDGTPNGDYNENQIRNYSMFLRNNTENKSYTTGSKFDATGYFDAEGVLNTTYTSYDGGLLPVEVKRSYSVVPNENFMIVTYDVTNLTSELQNFSILDMLHVENHSTSNITSSYQSSTDTIVTDMTAAGQYVIAHGCFGVADGFQVANDADSNAASATCSPWVTFDQNGTLKNNTSVNATDISTAYMKSVSLGAHETQTFSFYTAICGSATEMQTTLTKIRTKTAAEWTQLTRNAYDAWLRTGKQTSLPDSRLNDAYNSILVLIKQSTVPGSYEDSAGNTVHKFAAMPATTNPSAYSYKVWARDSAVTAMSYDASGHLDEAEAYWLWLADRQIKSDQGDWKQPGAFWTCYWLWDNSPVSFVEPEYDSVGMFLIGVYRHYEALPAAARQAFLNKIWPAYKMSSDLVCNGIQSNGFGAGDCSIWEEQFEYNAFTQALYAAGLDAAQKLAKDLGLQDLADSYNGAAGTIRSAIQRSSTDGVAGLYNTTDGDSNWWYYNRAVNLDGTPRTTVDSSSDVLFTYGVLDMASKRAYNHYRKITATISRDGTGIARYQGDTFYTGKNSWDPGGAETLDDEPSWPQMTMWIAMMELNSGYHALQERGYDRLQWYVDRTALGYMPAGECVSNITFKPVLSTMCEPITGAAYIMTALAYDEQFDMRIVPQQYNAGAYQGITVNGGCTNTSDPYDTVSDWGQWTYVPYYLDEIGDTGKATRDIHKVYLCNDDSNLYIRIDTAGKSLPVYQAPNDLFSVAVYSEDFKHQTMATNNTSLQQSLLGRDCAFAFMRSSDSDVFHKFTAAGGNWSQSGAITNVIAPQWETNSGRIEMVIPLSELSSTGVAGADDWANLVIAIGDNSGSGWQDSDLVHIHYRITSSMQTWLFGNSEV